MEFSACIFCFFYRCDVCVLGSCVLNAYQESEVVMDECLFIPDDCSQASHHLDALKGFNCFRNGLFTLRIFALHVQRSPWHLAYMSIVFDDRSNTC